MAYHRAHSLVKKEMIKYAKYSKVNARRWVHQPERQSDSPLPHPARTSMFQSYKCMPYPTREKSGVIQLRTLRWGGGPKGMGRPGAITGSFQGEAGWWEADRGMM